MPPIVIASLAILAGFAVLMKSADWFVNGAAATARNFGMSPMLVGLTIVSIGTSAPEILVSSMAALDGHSALAVGNALGSNIANIGLVLGITALVAPLPVQSSLIKKELPLLCAVTVISGVCLLDGRLDRIDGVILLALLALVLYLMFRWQKTPEAAGEAHYQDEVEQDYPELSQSKAFLQLAAGLVLLMASSKLLVWGATTIATQLGVSDLVIGLTIVAIGTSLPELAASVASALKGHHDIALGNVVGSNLFNLLAVMSAPALIAPEALDTAVLWRDFPAMLALTALLFIMARKQRIGRIGGLFFAGTYVAYTALLFIIG
ncbi:calcium/sodium antiporter [Spongorhabdus nitratireducens]